nr:MAG TPA: hypothetical protein [Caudoviricetes sp.]
MTLFIIYHIIISGKGTNPTVGRLVLIGISFTSHFYLYK